MEAHATHEVLIPTGLPQGGIARVGDLLNYSGEPDFKFRPLDPAKRKTWEATAADANRLAEALERSPRGLCQPNEKPEVFDYVPRVVQAEAV